jgi:hypothetical protein
MLVPIVSMSREEDREMVEEHKGIAMRTRQQC